MTQPCTKPCCDVAPLRDNPLTPDLTAKQLQFVRSVSDARAQAYPHGTEPWHPGEPDDHLAGFATKEDRDAYQRHAPGPFERVRRATPPTCEDLRRLVDGPDAAAVAYLRKQAAALPRDFVDEPDTFAVQHLRGVGPSPSPAEYERAVLQHTRDEIRRYLDSESRRGDVWLLEDAVARREPPLLGEHYDAFKDRAADLLAAAGWRVGYPVTDVPRLLAIAAERGRGAR